MGVFRGPHICACGIRLLSGTRFIREPLIEALLTTIELAQLMPVSQGRGVPLVHARRNCLAFAARSARAGASSGSSRLVINWSNCPAGMIVASERASTRSAALTAALRMKADTDTCSARAASVSLWALSASARISMRSVLDDIRITSAPPAYGTCTVVRYVSAYGVSLHAMPGPTAAEYEQQPCHSTDDQQHAVTAVVISHELVDGQRARGDNAEEDDATANAREDVGHGASWRRYRSADGTGPQPSDSLHLHRSVRPTRYTGGVPGGTHRPSRLISIQRFPSSIYSRV